MDMIITKTKEPDSWYFLPMLFYTIYLFYWCWNLFLASYQFRTELSTMETAQICPSLELFQHTGHQAWFKLDIWAVNLSGPDITTSGKFELLFPSSRSHQPASTGQRQHSNIGSVGPVY